MELFEHILLEIRHNERVEEVEREIRHQMEMSWYIINYLKLS